MFVYPHLMVCPGALVPSHAALATDCFACHAPLRGAVAARCVVCHVVADIGLQTDHGRGASPAGPSRRHSTRSSIEQNCMACHSDHPRPRLTQAQPQDLLARAPAQGSARDTCASCHAAPKNTSIATSRSSCGQCHATRAGSRPPSTTSCCARPYWTAARAATARPPTRCTARSRAAASHCHRPSAWKPATFDHDKYFVLDRDHHATCETCHTERRLQPLHLLRLPRALAGQSARGARRRRHSRLRELRRVPPGSARGAREGRGPRAGTTREGLKAMRSSRWCWSFLAAVDDADGRRRHHEDPHRR